MSPLLVRRLAWAAAIVLAIGVAILTVDWAVASRRAPNDDRVVKHYQKEVKENPTVAVQLEDEQKRITAARMSRRTRGRAVAWTLLAASAIFLASVNHLLGLRQRRFAGPRTLKAPPTNRKESRNQRGAPAKTEPDADIDIRFVDQIVACLGRDEEAALGLLQAIQAHYRDLRPSLPLASAYERARGEEKTALEFVWRRQAEAPEGVIERLAASHCRDPLDSPRERALRSLLVLSNPSLQGLLRRVAGKIFQVEIGGWSSECETRNAAGLAPVAQSAR